MTNFEGGQWADGVPTGSDDVGGFDTEGLTQQAPISPFSPQPDSLSQQTPPAAQYHPPSAYGPPGAQQQPYQAQQGQQLPFQAQQPYQAQAGNSPFIGTPGHQFAQSSSATAGVVISIVSFCLGFATCGLGFIGSPFGLYIGYSEHKKINAGQSDPAQKGTATAAMVIGGLGTLALVVGLVFIALVMVTAITDGATS